MPDNQPRHALRSSLILLLTACIWGLAFVAQRVGMSYIGPFLFAGLRFSLGGLTLALILLASRRPGRRVGGEEPVKAKGSAPSDPEGTAPGDPTDAPTYKELPANPAPVLSTKKLFQAGAVAGFFLFGGGILQQIGLVYTSASKASFLTALYIVLVPVLSLLIGRRIRWNSWLGVGLALVGLYFLSVTESLAIQAGDLVVIAGAFFWAGHILAVGRYVGGLQARDVYRFCIAQFLLAGGLSLALAPFADGFFVERVFDLRALADALLPILYAGVLSTGVAFTLQAIGQQGLRPEAAAIIMSLEAVAGVLGGVVILQEALTPRELVGCLLMFVAVLLSQLPASKPKGETG